MHKAERWFVEALIVYAAVVAVWITLSPLKFVEPHWRQVGMPAILDSMIVVVIGVLLAHLGVRWGWLIAAAFSIVGILFSPFASSDPGDTLFFEVLFVFFGLVSFVEYRRRRGPDQTTRG